MNTRYASQPAKLERKGTKVRNDSADYAARIKDAGEALARQNIPEGLRNLCAVNGSGETNVSIRSVSDATDAELVELAALGYGLQVFASTMPPIPEVEIESSRPPNRNGYSTENVFDLAEISVALASFRRITIIGQSRRFVGWAALESATSAEELTLINPPTKLDLSRLPRLQEVNLEGWNAVSALSNTSVTRVSLDVANIPDRFRIDRPIRSLSLSVSRGDVDLALLRDRSQLQWLSVSGGGSVSLKPLADARRLDTLMLFGCKNVRHAEALIGLQSLNSVDFDGVRALDHPLAMLELKTHRLMVLRNYVFDDDFIAAASTLRPEWVIDTYRQRLLPSSKNSAASNTLPFVIEHQPIGSYDVSFDDWEAFAEVLEAAAPLGFSRNLDMDDLARAIIERDDPELLGDPGISFDSESSAMHLVVGDLERATRAATVLAKAWRNETELSKLVRTLV